MLLKIVFFISSHFYAFLSISGGPEARISPRCSIHVICKKEKIKRFFLRISGEMAKKRRNMQPTAKRNGSMQGFAPRKHPRQACSLDCIAKLRFAFQPALQARQLRQTFRSSRQAHLLRQPASTHPPSIFSYRPHSLPSSNTQQQPAGFTCRLPLPSPLHFSFSFFPLFFLFFFSYFSEIILNTGSSSTGSSGL